MDKWIDDLYNCNCWHPVIDVEQMLACQCRECGFDCHKQKFQTMTDLVHNEYGLSVANRQAMRDCMGSMKGMDNIAHAYIMNKTLIVESLIHSTPVPVSGCNHHDPGLLKAQGYTGAVPKHWDSVWKPYTIAYPVKPTPTTIQLPLTLTTKTRQFYEDAQRNANRIWSELGITQYVDLSNGVKDPTTHTVIRPIYNRSFVVTFRGKRRKAYNNIGEIFNFYDGDRLASGPYDPSFKYKSVTEMGHHNLINKHSHTNTYRSDCSLWYSYNQHRLLQRPSMSPQHIKFDPPRNDRQRYQMWSVIREIPAKLELMTI